MKSQTQKIISLVFAIIVGIIDYANLAVSKSICYYSGDGQEKILDLRDACYTKYSNGRFIAEIIFVSLIAYFVAFYVLKIFRDRKTNKFETSDNTAYLTRKIDAIIFKGTSISLGPYFATLL